MGFPKIGLVVSGVVIFVGLSGAMAYAAVHEAQGETAKVAVAIGLAVVGAATAWFALRLRRATNPVRAGGAVAVVIGIAVARGGGWAALVFTSLLCGFFVAVTGWMLWRVPAVLRSR